MMFRALVPAVIFAILVVFFWTGLSLNPSEVPSPLIGKPVPGFSLPALGESSPEFSSARLSGQVSLFNVWATWCVGCRQEHDMLLAIARENLVPVFGLNYKDERDKALRWLQELGDPYVANGFDQEGRVAIDWGVYGAPETFVIDAGGIIRYKHLGPITPQVWQQTLRPLILQLKESQG